jgi:hypothetical protein
MSAATGRADGRPYVHPAKFPDDMVDCPLPLDATALTGDGPITAVSVAAAPSGVDELTLTAPTVDTNAVWVTLAGGQPGRIYTLKYLATLASGQVREIVASITVARVQVTDQPTAPASNGFGATVTWSGGAA